MVLASQGRGPVLGLPMSQRMQQPDGAASGDGRAAEAGSEGVAAASGAAGAAWAAKAGAGCGGEQAARRREYDISLLIRSFLDGSDGERHQAAVAEARRHLGGGGKRGWLA